MAILKSKRDFFYVAAIVLLTGLCAQFYYSYRHLPAQDTRVYYNKDQKLNEEIITHIRQADSYVYFAIYTFTRLDLKDALLAAKYRGVNVRGITDKEQYQKIENQREIINELRAAGIEVLEEDHSGIMHLKTLVTEKVYISGSYNWTLSATDSNDEILEIGNDPEIRRRYEEILLAIFKRYGT